MKGELEEIKSRLSDLENDGMGQVEVTSEVTEDWLQIPFRFVSVGALSTALVTRTIAGDGPFDLVQITHTAVDANSVSNDNFRVRIREGESIGRALTQDGEFVDANNTSGTASEPYIIKGRRRFRANIAIAIDVTNTLSVTNTIEMVLHGLKVFVR